MELLAGLELARQVYIQRDERRQSTTVLSLITMCGIICKKVLVIVIQLMDVGKEECKGDVWNG